MLALSIAVFVIEISILLITSFLNLLTDYVLGVWFSWIVVFAFATCTLLAVIALISNIKEIREGWSKAKSIVGTVFSGLALLFGAIFLITFLVTLITLLGQARTAYVCLF